MTDVRFAAVVHDGGEARDAMMWRVVQRLQEHGLNLSGLLTWRGKDPHGRLPMQIKDVRRGELFAISQALGPGSQACSLDPAALAQASAVLRLAQNEAADLVLVNRFGAMEASGRGFAAEMLALMSEGQALLTVVSAQYQQAWLAFTGTAGGLLPVEETAIVDWALAVYAASRSAQA